ncbi:MFS transporter [Bradyrhizobium sp. LHD-71]|uniref:MFS transporter n=1 Tax=Bradyrhizobium sp. LHD-71 TaxID=3072141 RepID=UPI00280E4707|nr:MFS transporter [Bradyrhizobium sp. LHD-71]MDQ8731565.1 MFS transporter [Bradyrhizobium sp. LHD-71]
MRPPPEQSLPSILVVLAVSQLVGWGTVSLPAVIGEQLARDLGLGLPAVFAGTTVMLVVTGLTASLIANAFVAYGARLVMAAGSLIAAPGFLLLAAATGPFLYYAGWVVLGVAGAAMLSTATYILLNEIAGIGAKRPIGALMLVTGLSSSLFWPITAALTDALGWRLTLVIYSASMVAVCFPLHAFGLPRRRKLPAADLPSKPSERVNGVPGRLSFALLTGVIALHAFVSWGIGSIIIQLLKSIGVGDTWALRVGALLGVIQVSARGLDFFGGAHWSGLVTGLVAAVIMPIGFLVLLFGGPADWAIGAFMLLYGGATGLMAVARATMPLVFYDSAAFARASSHIALPANLAAAASPPFLVAVLTNFGSSAVLTVALGCSLVALALLFGLVRLHEARRLV